MNSYKLGGLRPQVGGGGGWSSLSPHLLPPILYEQTETTVDMKLNLFLFRGQR